MPAEHLRDLAANGDILRIQRRAQLMLHQVSQGVQTVQADTWQKTGITGRGTKVGIIEPNFGNYQAFIGSGGALGPNVDTTSCSGIPLDDGPVPPTRASSHGTAVAEIVHEVAPDATLVLAAAKDAPQVGEAANCIVNAGVDVIAASITRPVYEGPGDGTAYVADPDALNPAVDGAVQRGIIWVNTAGNAATSHWSGAWSDPNNNGTLNFTSSDEDQDVIIQPNQEVTISLRWTDTAGRNPWGGACDDYDLLLIDDFNNIWTADSADRATFAWGSNRYGIFGNGYYGQTGLPYDSYTPILVTANGLTGVSARRTSIWSLKNHFIVHWGLERDGYAYVYPTYSYLLSPYGGALNSTTAVSAPAGAAIVSGVVYLPGNMVFGDTIVGGNTSTQSVTVQNQGSASLTINAVTLLGQDQSQFTIGANTCSGVTLAPGQMQSCSVSVTFRPTTAGQKSASLTFDNTGLWAPNDRSISGNGVNAADLSVTLAETPNPIRKGKNATYTATVVNNGPANATSTSLQLTMGSDLSFVSATPSIGTCSGPSLLNPSTVSCSLGTLNNASRALVQVVVQAAKTARGSTITSTSVSSSIYDQNTANNRASRTTPFK